MAAPLIEVGEIVFEKKLSFQAALKHVQMLVRPDMFMATEALVFLDEEMILFATRLANHTCTLISPNVKANTDLVEASVKAIFGKNMAKWAFTAGIKAVMSFRKTEDPAKRWLTPKSPFPIEKLYTDVMQERFDEEATVYFAAVLEYVCADALESAGNRADTSSRKIILEKDVLYTLSEEPELKVLFEIKKQKKKAKEAAKFGSSARKKKASISAGSSVPRDSIVIAENGEYSPEGGASSPGGTISSGDLTPKSQRRLSLFKAFSRKSVRSPRGSDAGSSPASLLATPVGSEQMLRAYSSGDLPYRPSSSGSNNLSPSPDSVSLSSATSETDLQRSPDLAQARRIAEGSRNIRRLSVRNASIGAKPKSRPSLPSTQEFAALRIPETNLQPYSKGGVLGVMSNITEIKVLYPNSTITRLRVQLPSGASTVVEAADDMKMAELLNYVCTRRHLKMSEYALRVAGADVSVDLSTTVSSHKISEIELVQRPDVDKQDDSNLVCLVERNEVTLVLKVSGTRSEIKAAKVHKLIERIADENALDGYYVDTILLTFRSFIEPEDLFYMLLSRFKLSLPENPIPEEIAYYAQWKRPIQMKVCNFIIRWVERYFQDFYESKELLDSLLDLCEFIQQEGMEDKANELSQCVADQLQRFERIHISMLPLEKTDLSVDASEADNVDQSEEGSTELMDKDAQFIAEQITLFDHELFNKVHRVEYLSYVWQASKVDDLCPNLNILISRFNRESYWVATVICTQPELKKRVELIKKFILVGKSCMELQNYFTVFSIVGGLSMAPVQRLKKSWEQVSAKYKTMLTDLESVMNPSQNMKAYRELALQSKPPMIPVLPVYVKDLFFINDGNEKETDNLINFEKLEMLAAVVRNITAICSVPFEHLVPDRDAQLYLKNPTVISNTLLLKNHSLDCEPAATPAAPSTPAPS
ncbi:hypothetical protein CAOG_02158 [Capsaspora owczarzaki ATCC 30864]|uniref:Uncharacterized protein n=1 Tax=Capsaspora owczarzaki (strain ATCC 30864) TaxID=595528 RepID=A0A0D2U6Z5_CAPO3|nr:hypothetical protein CAOG_02158 [Capsaspora owczarzaki ATCC 30864]KJE90930.1 hypothetical protein CAOG_002158 [Capsaspora owczarzaki ATCC 30864]KJE90931.1 hypothetical protein, variant 1 [Capsaspora owczarzaki ATCC 30864]KJE90932.1 hypothetical protein, variant 2 [Capsaspora owczarzaki ATCC 30864]|eukprot:XP_004348908.1 hypothetical protein CAOG_02158 [Capsaspora owczarzaki ATCC 30864]